MSLNPFQADQQVSVRLAQVSPASIVQLRQRAKAMAVDAVISAADADGLAAAFGLAGVRDLMLLLLDEAKAYARPDVSQFFVGAVGLEMPSGNLILGGNVEFPGTHLGYTLHGEGFVATRAFNRGTSLAVIAIGEAHPCAHCRQYLSEFAWAQSMELIDPLGHTLTLAQLYPWPFDPAYLGEPGAEPARLAWPDLQLGPNSLPVQMASRLLDAGRHAHAPYSKSPGAMVLELVDGHLVAGSSVESVAFNPTIGPLQGAIVELLAGGRGYAEIRRAALGTVVGGAVDYAASTHELLGKIAPDVALDVIGWRL